MTAARAVSGPAPRTTRAQRYPVASIWPLVMGLIALGAGLALAVWTASTATPQPFVGDATLPFAAVSTLPLSVGGYVLTPLVVFAALIWDRLAQRLGLRDRNFALKPKYTRLLQVAAVVAMVPGIWHVLNIAYGLSGS